MIKLHLGCGWRNFGKDWIHIDGGDYEHLQYQDIEDLSQFDSDSVDLIYASHVIEYFDRNHVQVLLKEWHRVLRKDATLRLAVPDLEILFSLYVDKKILLNQLLGPTYGKMPMGNIEIFHKTGYDYNDLEDVLMKAGFRDVTRWDWRQTEHADFDDHSQAYIPHMDKKNGQLISLNVEAKK